MPVSPLHEHVKFAEEMERQATHDAHGAEALDAWAYPRVALQWASRYYASERELAEQMIKDLDEADAAYARSGGGAGVPHPSPRYWQEVEQQFASDEEQQQQD
ncbi:hypothetical protein [Mycolicibacterium mengxianglii]|uniref:hypothetical protein n=1 Tax=Mycolicibacterium mengxianglii TaxID=2736649 RepID=UPI0018D0506C|nr:hypothetical protein [Mycolicibacterium mengxianglii]